jgi:RHS repeat-associated protein
VLGTRTYTPNGLNQYAGITTTTTRTVTGRAPAADPVSVNGTALTAGNRIGDIFHFTLPSAANSSSPVWQLATIVSQGTTIERAFYHPKADTTPMYDLDGNLVNDGRWVYSWDAENRLIQMESTTQAVTAGAPYRKLVFRYDTGGRRLSKTVYHGTASTPVFDSSTRWVYDGWNPVSEFTATAETGGTFTRTKSYTWGLDLSGKLQGAGGVGGLLAVTVHNGFSRTNYCPSYDGNGNIVAWTLEGQTLPVSRREYGAFGNTMVEQGTAPSEYGFSTEAQDTDTGLYYYGYRYYDPVTGRWPSRDPLEEKGGVNLYGFAGNSPISYIDILGLLRNACCLEEKKNGGSPIDVVLGQPRRGCPSDR